MVDSVHPAPRVAASFRHALLLFVALVLGMAARSARAADDWTTTSVHWYVLEIDGAVVGYSREASADNGTAYRTTSETKLRIKRGAIELAIEMDAQWDEAHDGTPQSLTVRSQQGQQAVNSVYVFDGDSVKVTSTQAGRTTTSTFPAPDGSWFTPQAGTRYLLERIKAEAKSFSLRAITPDGGLKPIESTFTYLEAGEVEFDGRTIPVTYWRTVSEAMPVPARRAISSDGVLVSESASLPGIGTMRTTLATEAQARAAQGGAAPEILVSTFVPVEPPITNPRERHRATLHLTAKDGGELPAFPEAGAQRVAVNEDGSVRLTVDINDNVPATDEERADPAYVGASAMCDANDPMVRKLAQRAVRKVSDDPAERAEAIRGFVHSYIRDKNLDTGFGTATEVARTREGDCSEHGVLTCAMLRAAGIPARVATGLVYADTFAGERSIFGWHMWTQALIDGKWVDFDATLPVRYDAAHILTNTSALSETSGAADFSTAMLLMGNLEVTVESIE